MSSPSRSDLTVGIITYNSEKYLLPLLRSIVEGSILPSRIIIVDNASSDETRNILSKIESSFEIPITSIHLPENVGHSAGANILLKENKTQFLMLIDHDVTIEKDCIQRLLQAREQSEDPSSAVFIPAVHDIRRREDHFGGSMHYLGKMTIHTSPPKTDSTELEMVGTTAPLLDMSRIPKSLLFDEHAFIYVNDVDFFYRLRTLGRKLFLVPDAEVWHGEGTPGFSQGESSGDYSSTRAYYIMRNTRFFVLKNYSFWTLMIICIPLSLYEFLNLLFSLQKKVFWKAYVRSVIETFRHLPKLFRKRRLVQKNRTISDRNLLSWSDLVFNPGVITSSFEQAIISFGNVIFKLWSPFFSKRNQQ